MYKIAITIRKKEDCFTFFMNDTYFQFLSPVFQIELVVPRHDHNYQDIVSRNDALLICGGNDINPSYYYQDSHSSNTLEDQFVESMDFALLQQFYYASKKIFGICRGIQVLNVFFHGNLYQDISSHYSTHIHHNCDFHFITPIKNTFLQLYFPKRLKVNSFHHQNILKPSPLFRINVISEDGLIEGIENHQVIAVQWHPERMDKKHQEQFLQMMVDFIDMNK